MIELVKVLTKYYAALKLKIFVFKNHKFLQEDKSAEASSESDEEEEHLLKFFEQQRSGQTAQNAEEVVVTAAKEMGKELYANLSHEERRNKLDTMVCSPTAGNVHK